MKAILEKLKKSVAKSRTAIITSHIDPDGDAIGSLLALGMILEKKKISVTYYCQDDVPKVYSFLPGANKIKKDIFPKNHFDLAFVVDCSDLCRAGNNLDVRSLAPILIDIDHHPDNKRFGDINYVMNTSSVAEEIYDICKAFKVKIDYNMAVCLYTAMITDNGNFRYENTTDKTFTIASELLRAGIKTHELTTRIYDNRSLPSLKISARALLELKLSPDRKIAWAGVSEKMMEETSAKSEDLIGLVDRIRSIDGVEVAIFFRAERDRVKINFRSKDKVNVSEIAAIFGGGGHAKAAGAIVVGPIAEVQEKVVAAVQKAIG